MASGRAHRLITRLLAAALPLAAPAAAWAQCAMCKTTASNMDPGGVKYLNYATLLLVVPPVVIFCGFIYAAYKRRDAPDRDF
ncbi:MAG TPA: hypothetical protein VM864_09475 [Pyrinomonadaceae bacterium]|jgi:peptidoglycan biosynthesis protein MviN/MurJ (putative lipid II flippase)|nr:hypothetical protein [Pyrinomonadaceae bacterium]